jgi:CDP-paratose 2-epimerase
VRDVLDVGDAVEAYLSTLDRIQAVAGRAFNLGGGPANAVSLRQLLAHVEALIGRPVDMRFSDWRAGDQRWYVSDARRAQSALGLRPPTPWRAGVAALARWLADERSFALPAERAAAMPARRAGALS